MVGLSGHYDGISKTSFKTVILKKESGQQNTRKTILKCFNVGLAYFLYFFIYWHDRMRSLRQGVRILNFEEKKTQKKKKTETKQKKKKKSSGCVLTK